MSNTELEMVSAVCNCVPILCSSFRLPVRFLKKELNCYNFPITVDDIKKPEIMQCDDFGDFRLSELFVLENLLILILQQRI